MNHRECLWHLCSKVSNISTPYLSIYEHRRCNCEGHPTPSQLPVHDREHTIHSHWFVDCDSSLGMKEGEWCSIVRDANSGFQNLSRIGSPNYSIDAKSARDNFCEYVNSEDGALSWQLDHVRSCGRRNRQNCQV